MYFIQNRTKNLFLTDTGAASVLDFRKGNCHLIACKKPANAKAILKSIRASLTKKEAGCYQIVGKKNFEKLLVDFDIDPNVPSPLPQQESSTLCSTVTYLLQRGQCHWVESSDYCKPIEKPVEEVEKVEITEKKLPQEMELSYPFRLNTNSELEVSAERHIDEKNTVKVTSGSENALAKKITEVIEAVREIIEISTLNLRECDKNIKMVENQILDELHFIEFDTEGLGNPQEVYQRLHELRQMRRRLKDDLILSEMIQELFKPLTSEALEGTLETVASLSHRVYRLRAPGEHPHRGM